MVETAKIIWADGPTGEPFEPEKSLIRAWGTWLENMTNALGMAVTAAYIRGTKAQLDAVTGAVVGAVGIVVADDDVSLRGVYVKTSTAWVKKLDLPADAAAAAAEIAEDARDVAIDARLGAEAARDIAAGYASDAVSQGNVPIYSSVSGMSALTIPVGMLSVRVNGFTAAGDGGGGLYVRSTSQPTGEYAGLAFRSADRFLPDGSTSSANGGWWAWKGKFSMREVCEKIASRLGRGDRTVIACYGDSTTDGNNTSGHTPNPRDADNNAIGDTNHNLFAPNAWPMRMMTVLSPHYANENYYVMNCGYSGRRMNNGWAVLNFNVAVVQNCITFAGGIPYAVIINFGLNDIIDSSTDSNWLNNHISETRKLCRLAMSLGIIPMLQTCDPMWRSDPAGYDSYKSVEMVDAAKVAIAQELGIAILDTGTDLKKWMAINKDRHDYYENQSDALHGGDIWHAFKGAAVARHFMRNYVERAAGRGAQRISASDAAYRNFLGQAQAYQIKQTRDGAVYTTGDRVGTPFLTTDGLVGDVWIWNEDPDAELIYRGVANENYESGDLATYTKPSHVIRDFANLSIRASRIPSGIGFAAGGHGNRVDSPYRVGKLAYGMNRVQHNVANSPYYFIGHYEIRSTGEWRRDKYGANASAFPYAIQVNAMRGQGRLAMEVDRAVAGVTVVFLPEADDFSNVIGLMDGDRAQLYLRTVLPVGCGVILGWVPSFLNRTGDRDNKSFLMLYKAGANSVQFYVGSVNNGAVTYAALGSAGTTVQTADAEGAEKYLFTIDRFNDTMRLQLSESWDFPASTIISYAGAAGAITAPGAFVMGGLFANISASSGYYNPKIMDYFGKQMTIQPGVPEPALVAL